VRWVIWHQQTDGAWVYYADQEPVNFIDCFHSCFVVKNLIKTRKPIPEIVDEITPSVNRGEFIRSRLYNERHGLCRRFITSDIRDPFRWDLYDQAEYLGLLVDFGLLEKAREFRQRVEFRFRKGKHWYCAVSISLASAGGSRHSCITRRDWMANEECITKVRRSQRKRRRILCALCLFAENRGVTT
jgi:hypothetical protein